MLAQLPHLARTELWSKVRHQHWHPIASALLVHSHFGRAEVTLIEVWKTVAPLQETGPGGSAPKQVDTHPTVEVPPPGWGLWQLPRLVLFMGR